MKLWCAAKKGELNVVQQQINKGVDVNFSIEDMNNTTPLLQSIILGYPSIVSALIEAGADINKPDKHLASPLYHSLSYYNQPMQPSIVKSLISNGANVNQSMYDRDTPLHMACYKGYVGVIKLLLNKGANINATNDKGKTPLHLSIEWPGIENEAKMTCIKYLLLKSASTLITDNAGINPINSAITNFPEAVNWLEHPETLPNLQQFEASIIGLTQDFII